MSDAAAGAPLGQRAALVQLVLVVAAVAWSAWQPHDRAVWWLEISPVLLGVGTLAVCWRRFPWSPVACLAVTTFALVICVGAHYTYALVPAGFEVQSALGLSRNPYDRLGHLLQGVTPALLARELLQRRLPLRPGAALFWIVAAVTLSISACYELGEWWTTLLVDPEAGTAFLAMQGDPWDTQWDMALALGGAVGSQLVLGRVHDRQIARLAAGASAAPRG